MTENGKKFLEFLSKQDEETRGKAAKLEKKALIAFAAEKGFALTDADFEKQDAEGEVSLDEADAVAGGGVCACVVGGGGAEGKRDGVCACVITGWGEDGKGIDGDRCYCFAGGGGKSYD